IVFMLLYPMYACEPSLSVVALDRAPDQQGALGWSRYRSFNQYQISLGVNPQHLQVLYRHAVVTMLTCHPLALHHPGRRRAGPQRPWRAQAVRLAMGLLLTAETVPFHTALETMTLGCPGHVHQLARGECICIKNLP